MSGRAATSCTSALGDYHHRLPRRPSRGIDSPGVRAPAADSTSPLRIRFYESRLARSLNTMCCSREEARLLSSDVESVFSEESPHGVDVIPGMTNPRNSRPSGLDFRDRWRWRGRVGRTERALPCALLSFSNAANNDDDLVVPDNHRCHSCCHCRPPLIVYTRHPPTTASINRAHGLHERGGDVTPATRDSAHRARGQVSTQLAKHARATWRFPAESSSS